MKNRLSTLGFIIRCLSADKSPKQQTILRSAISSGKVDWAGVLSIANEQLISPTLWTELQARGLAGDLPADVRDYLHEIHRLNRVRNERLRLQTIEIVKALNGVGIAPVLLKGAVSLFTDAYDDPGSRVMRDLDILVPAKDAQQCWNLLRSLGYAPIESDHGFSHHHHLHPLERPGECAAVELHLDVTVGEAKQILPTERIWAHCRPVRDSGLEMYVADPTSRVMHCLLHEAIREGGCYHLRWESLPLRSLHELTLMASRYSGSIDWGLVLGSFDRNGKAQILGAWLYLLHHLLSCHLPKGTRATPVAIAFYFRYCLQAHWAWIGALARDVCQFSSRKIQRRYGCDRRFRALSVARLRLFLEVSSRYCRSVVRWAGRRASDVRLDS